MNSPNLVVDGHSLSFYQSGQWYVVCFQTFGPFFLGFLILALLCVRVFARVNTTPPLPPLELHHLLIMESLGGNSSVIDRTIAQTMAFGYYWYVVAVYAFSEPAAYHLSELIEDHAYDTYNGYLNQHESMLKQLPVPAIARKYYVDDNPFLFDQFCTVKDQNEGNEFSSRRPTLESLYDVFVNVRDDEKEHWKTLCNLVQYNDMQGIENKLVQGTKPAASKTL